MQPFSRFLLYFLAVARHKSIRKAAEDLHIAGSAINRHILLGEKQLQTPLFERLPTGMRLTAAGELLYGCARRWTKDLDDLTRQIDDLKGIRRGQVDLLAPEALSRAFLPELVARMKRSHPGVVLNINIRDNRRICPTLLSGDGDLALVLDPEETRDLVVVRRLSFPLGFACRPGHPLARHAAVRLADCAACPMIAPEQPLALASMFTRLVEGGRMTPMVAARANNVQMIISLVTAGVGICFLSSLDVMSEVMRGDVAFVPLIGSDMPHLTLALVHDRTRQLSRVTHLVGNIMGDIMTQPMA
ncbi:LysR family transcriptional regulator [Gluconacetobacter entanii]|uniref:LysR family transcriptional regulator n=1 Tax=Gluconacetobacter entanii TaxID=108528 RepID=A0ABT3K9Z9_9PROT|nr:LysR family transcriptional regulator [Gluconacetobacter entanii]MCE2577860.1 LysR family transcriptional regulator [Komagataeibacter sp. FNDCR1]MCW4592262.1 LysR family transcriptional regulator [Gluconacetobacter entanii]MCW4595729.1 LysR family transcriptional regulator [Gluconacetobacter entanii]NPC87476.1 LysR family transcriptional regulator [Gluconacetobacter entanii]